MFLAAVPPPVPILVHASEFTFNGSRTLGLAGRWRINLDNLGQDEHDIQVLDRARKTIVARSQIFLPGTHGTITVKLRPGTYTFFCGVADHRALGMRWRVKVVPRPRRTVGA